MIDREYTIGMHKGRIIQPSDMRWVNLTGYLAVAVIGVLGAGSLSSPPARLLFALLCVAFALVNLIATRTGAIARRPHWYFAAQTLLFVGMMALRPPSDAFIFLLFILTIQASIIFPGRLAVRWIVPFYLLGSSLGFLTLDLENAFGTMLLNSAAFLLVGMLGHSTRQTELARRDNQELVEILQTAQRQLQELAVVEERNRLAREIHDGLGHYLTATTMQIQGAKALLETTGAATQAPDALGALGKAETLLQEALADVRRSVGSLRAVPTESRSLPGAIGDLVAECRTAAGLTTRFDLQGTPRPLNPQVELTLYRAAQEGLTNVRKHAQAASVSVVLWYDAGKVGLRIADDGQGIGAALNNGYGLLGLRERVQIVGGAVGIDSAPGQGCRLEVEIPA
jgi:signal transduction histidine kinase